DILNFPKGYDTHVGERGLTLSGGQKQRLSIARALLLKKEILILDDVLSAVDRKTEHNILKNIYTWKKNGHTLI
ncbi:MAG: ATP-binding cassette domain-containing protein, partial [Serratia symbiotica]|nr:ATP-binding cassette domain-containing protein [Serratia symbiotica]